MLSARFGLFARRLAVRVELRLELLLELPCRLRAGLELAVRRGEVAIANVEEAVAADAEGEDEVNSFTSFPSLSLAPTEGGKREVPLRRASLADPKPIVL